MVIEDLLPEIVRRNLPERWRGCFYWVDVDTLSDYNSIIRGRRTDTMLIIPWGAYAVTLTRTVPEE